MTLFRLRPFHPLFTFFPSAFLAGSLSFIYFIFVNLIWRIVFLCVQGDALDVHHGWLLIKAVFLGLRLDGVIAGYLTLPVFITAFLPIIGWKSKTYQSIYTVYNIVCEFLISFIHLFDLEFFKEFGMHVNFLILHQTGNETELWSYLTSQYPLVKYVIILIFITIFFGWIFIRLMSYIRNTKAVRPILQFAAFIFLFSGLALACRGGWQERPVDWGYAIFSDNMLANQTALNSIFFFGRSIVELSSEDRLTKLLSVYPMDEAKQTTYELIRRGAHLQTRNPDLPKHPRFNVVIVILESFTGALCGFLNPQLEIDVTPHFDDLSAQGISFSRCYTNGQRSAHGISSIVTGRPSLPGLPLIYKVEAMSGIPTIGSILQSQGYSTTYYYGGDANYDNMSGFLKLNGFANILDQRHLPAESEGTSWGKFDHYLFKMAKEDMDQITPPFLSVLFTTTNHQPWSVPAEYDSHIPQFAEAPFHRQKTARSMAYVDQVIHEFLLDASSSDWFSSTIFVFTADHGLWVNHDDFDDPVNARIPLVIYNPWIIPQGRSINTVTSQADILPILLSLLDLDDSAPPLWGKNTLASADGFACRVVNDQIYWYEDDYQYKEILDQKKECFRILPDGNRFIETDINIQNTLEKHCRSYLQTAYFSLKEKNVIGQSTQPQNGMNVVNLNHNSDKQ